MSRQTVILRVPIDESWDAGDGLTVYTDYGTGAIDTDNPLTVKPIELFPGKRAAQGLGLQPVGMGRVGDGKASRPTRGIGGARVGVTPVGTAPPVMDVTVDVPAAFGSWKFAPLVVNRDGDPQTEDPDVVTAVVSGTEPPPLESFALNGYDKGTDQITFDFAKMTE